jgi:ferredoxin
MGFKVRDGEIDLAILSGPRLLSWPTHGARVLSRWCSDAGLKVGWYGGLGSSVRGVLPAEGSGGLVIMEDAQKRLHRIQAKAIVKVSPSLLFPMPFEGWYSPGMIPESTAWKLIRQGSLNWHPTVVVLGSGNRALRMGSEILRRGLCQNVIAIESVRDEIQAWEVERRYFEMLGGRIQFAKPELLRQKTPTTFESIWDQAGRKLNIEVARIISVGPFDVDLGFTEYPLGSYLIDWSNTESVQPEVDVEAYLLDEHRAVVLASRIIRGVGKNVNTEIKSALDKAIWQSKQKLTEMENLSPARFSWKHEGKWLSSESKDALHSFAGVPKTLKADKILATIECIEPIGCRVCEKECPAQAIQIDRNLSKTNQFLLEDLCTGCGRCVQVCPSNVPIMVEGDGSGSFTSLLIGYRERHPLKKGDRISLINRRGESLATSRILDLFLEGEVPIFKVEVPSHLIWEARGIVPLGLRQEVSSADEFYEERGARVDVQIQGNVRRVREGQMVSVALFEIGMSRPNDILICEDGSCGLCQIDVDGVKQFACQSVIHQGMTIRFTRDHEPTGQLCPCKERTVPQVEAHCKTIPTETIEALLESTDVTRGKCHGMLCRSSFLKVAQSNGVQMDRFSDWSFPWVDWTVS